MQVYRRPTELKYTLGTPLDQHFDQPSNLRSVYKTFCELSEIVHIVLYTLYSPSSEVNSRTLIAMYNQYIQWYDTIPESLRLGHNFTPSVLFAQLVIPIVIISHS